MALPLVYDDNASAHFEEQMVIRLCTIQQWFVDAGGRATLALQRTHVCIHNLLEASARCIHALQALQTILYEA